MWFKASAAMVNVSEGMPLTLTSIKGNFSLQSLPLLLLLALRLLLLIPSKQEVVTHHLKQKSWFQLSVKLEIFQWPQKLRAKKVI